MIIAVASPKRLSIQTRRQIKHNLRNVKDLTIPDQFNLQKHTICFDVKKRTIFEETRAVLSASPVKWLSSKDFQKTIVNEDFNKFFENAENMSNTTSLDISEIVQKNQDEAIEQHITNKPLLRKQLSDMTNAMLFDLATSKQIKIKKTSTKQQFIDAIVEAANNQECS